MPSSLSEENVPASPRSHRGPLLLALLRRVDLRMAWSGVRERFQIDRYVGLLLASMSAYAVVLSLVAVMRFNTFRTHAFDLGIFNQAFSTALQGRLFRETPDIALIPSGSFLGVHFNFLMWLLLPIYALAPRPETLLVLQSVFVALGAVPVFLVSRHLRGDGRAASLWSVVYLVNPAILSLNFYDFHLEAFLPLFLGMFYYSYLTRRWRWYAVFFLLSIFTIDFASVLVGSIALAHLVRQLSVRRTANGSRLSLRIRLDLDRPRALLLFATLVLSVASLFSILSLSAYFAGSGRSVGSTLSSFLQSGSPPDSWAFRAAFWFLSFGSLLFVPFLALRECVVSLPWFVFTLLPVPVTWYLFGYQYAGGFVAVFLIFAAIHGFGRIRSRGNARAVLAGAIVVSAFLTPLNPLMQGALPGIAYEQGLPIPNAHDAILHEVIALIPPHASVLTQNNLFPQVSGRSDVYLYRPTGNETIDYVLADTRTTDYFLRVWSQTPLSTELPQLMSTGEYGILASSDGVILLGRGYSGPVMVEGPTQYRYDYRDLIHTSGIVIPDSTSQSGTVFFYNELNASPNGFWVGPYAHLAPGRYDASFYLKASRTSRGNITLEIAQSLNATASRDIVSRTVDPSFFSAPDLWQPLALPFVLSYSDAGTGSMEFRSSGVRGGPFYFDYVLVTYLGPI